MLFLYLYRAICANPGNFRSCQDMRFCRENRNKRTSYVADLENVKLEKNQIIVNIGQKDRKTDLLMRITVLKNGGIRFRMDPVEQETFSRFDLSKENMVISQDIINEINDIKLEKSGSSIKVVFISGSVLVSNPLRIMVCRADSSPIMVINSENLLFFEHHGGKIPPEQFSGFTDTIPNGPTAVGVDFSILGEDIKISGLAERAGPLNLIDTDETPYRLFNTDAFEYEADNPMQLYGSIPLVIAHSQTVSCGLFWLNPTDTFVDISSNEGSRNLRVLSEGGYLDFVVFLSNPKSIVDQFTQLTGRPSMPPIFSLGYHQSRWGYQSQNEVDMVIRGLNEAKIPFDSIWLDLDHLYDKTPFGYARSFPSPENLISDLAENQRYLVRLCDPQLPHNSDHRQYKEARRNKYLVTLSTGASFTGDAWPGQCAFPDFLNPSCRYWWSTQFNYDVDISGTNVFYWNDMNEPSIFKNDQSTFPKSLIHYGNVENREVHNLYGLLNAASTQKGLINRNPGNNIRPFVLTRSFFAGVQRYAWTWSGDNTASWEHLSVSIPMVLASGICGMPFNGADVGGFLKSPDEVLLARWYQLASWGYTFFREHCHHKSARREPFLFENDEFKAIKSAIETRYRFLPTWYTLAYLSNQTGLPIVRPIWMEYPNHNVHDIENQFLLGSSLMIAPILEEDQETIEIQAPPGIWFSIMNGKILTDDPIDVGILDIPVYIKGGSIIPCFIETGKSSLDTLKQPFRLLIALDENGKAEGDLYMDDGETFDYLKGSHLYRHFSYNNGILKNTNINQNGNSPEIFKDSIISEVVVFCKGKMNVISGLSLKIINEFGVKV